jgi:hypothetical protein
VALAPFGTRRAPKRLARPVRISKTSLVDRAVRGWSSSLSGAHADLIVSFTRT